MMTHSFNRGHFIVLPSHAPLLMSLSLFSVASSLIMMLKSVGSLVMLIPVLLTWNFLNLEMMDMDKMSHVSEYTRSRYMVSFYWLIAAESFAFFSLLFSWFGKSAWTTTLGIGSYLDSASMPSALSLSLMNSALLLSSSVTITYSHMSLSMSSLDKTISSLVYTILLSSVFLMVQWVEFSESTLSIADSYYGALLFSSLGFHGMHVLVSVIFLSVAYWRVISSNSTPSSHPTYLCSVIYWHFVDVVWVFVYFSYYLAL